MSPFSAVCRPHLTGDRTNWNRTNRGIPVYCPDNCVSKLHNCNDSNTHLLGGCVVINQKECHSWCSNHVQTANYFNTLTVEMLNLFYYPKFKSSVPKSLCYIKMYSQLNFRSVIYSYLFSMSAVVSIQVKINFYESRTYRYL